MIGHFAINIPEIFQRFTATDFESLNYLNFNNNSIYNHWPDM